MSTAAKKSAHSSTVAQRTASILLQSGHPVRVTGWVVSLGIALVAVLYAVHVASSLPTVIEWITSSDQLMLPALTVDVFARPYNVFGWQVSRASFLFPDLVAYAGAYAITRDPLYSLSLAPLPTLLVWLYVVGTTAPREVVRNRWGIVLWGSVLGIFVPLVLTQSSDQIAWWVTKYAFSFGNHFAAFVFGALLLRWSVDWLYTRSMSRLAACAIVLAVIAASNQLVWIFYLIPLAALLAFMSIRSRALVAVPLAAVAVLAACAGYLIEHGLNRIEIMPYEYSLFGFGKHVAKFFVSTSDYAIARPEIAFFLVILVTFYGVAAYRLTRAFDATWRRPEGAVDERRWLYDAAILVAVLVNVAAASVAWESVGSARYLMAFFFAPALLASRVIGRSLSGTKLVAAAGALLTASALASAATSGSTTLAVYANAKTEPLVTCLRAMNLSRGLANYWIARHVTFLSGGRARIDQLTPWEVTKENLYFYWGNNAYSFLRGHPDIDPYDYVIANDLNRDVLVQAFGRPDEERKCDSYDIWKYHDRTWIFARLFQGHLESFQRLLLKDWKVSIPASVFRGEVGAIAGLAREADARRDPAGRMISGSALMLPRGSYRASIVYSSPPVAGGAARKVGTFEVLRSGSAERIGLVDLFEGMTGPALATLIIDATNAEKAIEPRVVFHGSGVLRLIEFSIVDGAAADNAIRLFANDDRIHTQTGLKENGLLRSNGAPGVLMYGPYLPLSAGRYSATVHFVGAPPPKSLGSVEVVSTRGTNVIARTAISPSTALRTNSGYAIEVQFELRQSVSDIELRVLVDADTAVEITQLDILPAS